MRSCNKVSKILSQFKKVFLASKVFSFAKSLIENIYLAVVNYIS